MAIFRSSILGDAHKSVQNVTMYRSRGQQILKSKPLRIKDARTPRQLQLRTRFRIINDLAARFREVFPVGFPAEFVTWSRNAFVRHNIEIVSVDKELQAEVDFSRLACSSGRRDKPAMSACLGDEGSEVVLVSSPQNISAYGSREDRLFAVLLERGCLSVQLVFFGTRGMVKELHVPLSRSWNPAMVSVYAFALSANGRCASNTIVLL